MARLPVSKKKKITISIVMIYTEMMLMVTSMMAMIAETVALLAVDLSRSSRSKKARNEVIEVVRELSNEMSNLKNLIVTAGEHIDKLASCFKHESEAVDRRMAVVSEVMKVQSLSQSDIIRVGRKIATNPLETDYFFSLPEEYRKAYILTLCSDLHSGGGR